MILIKETFANVRTIVTSHYYQYEEKFSSLLNQVKDSVDDQL